MLRTERDTLLVPYSCFDVQQPNFVDFRKQVGDESVVDYLALCALRDCRACEELDVL